MHNTPPQGPLLHQGGELRNKAPRVEVQDTGKRDQVKQVDVPVAGLVLRDELMGDGGLSALASHYDHQTAFAAAGGQGQVIGIPGAVAIRDHGALMHGHWRQGLRLGKDSAALQLYEQDDVVHGYLPIALDLRGADHGYRHIPNWDGSAILGRCERKPRTTNSRIDSGVPQMREWQSC